MAHSHSLLPRVLVWGVLCGSGGLAFAADETAGTAPAGVRCEVAVVSPVSGFAECVKPRGVPVQAPPRRPPPTAEACRRHEDLEVKECPDPTPAAAPDR